MTTIAFRDGVLAADTLVSWSGGRAGSLRKIVQGPEGALAGACGTASFTWAFLRWFEEGESGAPPDRNKDDGDEGMIVRPNGVCEVYDCCGRHDLIGPYVATGSGWKFALGAMFVGADAEGAVRAAMQHDVATGGDVVTLSLSAA